MVQSFADNNLVNIRLRVTRVYTLKGVKYLYRLSDMVYGEWLIYKDGKPFFYFNIFDDDYKDIKDEIGGDVENYLRIKLIQAGKEWSLKQYIFGIPSSGTFDEQINIEKLPKNFLVNK